LPSKEEYQQLKGDLEFKEKEMEKSENTIEAIMRGKHSEQKETHPNLFPFQKSEMPGFKN
jgi:hypothetical protein